MPRVALRGAPADALCMAIDQAVERYGHLVPADRETPTGVGYLRYAPAGLVLLLTAHWPYTRAAWRGRRRGQPGRTVPRREVCFPLVYLESLTAFLRLAGHCHVGRVRAALALDPEAVHELPDLPEADPDF